MKKKILSIILLTICALPVQNLFAVKDDSIFCRRNRMIAEGVVFAGSLLAWRYFIRGMEGALEMNYPEGFQINKFNRNIALICALLSGGVLATEGVLAIMKKNNNNSENPKLRDGYNITFKKYCKGCATGSQEHKFGFVITVQKLGEAKPSMEIKAVARTEENFKKIEMAVNKIDKGLSRISDNEKQKNLLKALRDRIDNLRRRGLINRIDYGEELMNSFGKIF